MILDDSFDNTDVRRYVQSLSVDQLARWVCLIEGVNFIMDKMEDLGMQDDIFMSKTGMNNLEKALQKYIRERESTVRSDILIDHTKIKLF